MSLGGMFFLVQVAALILFQTDNLIIAHYLGAAAVTPYSVTWRLFNYTMIFQVLASPSYWPAYTEAFARGDRAWVRRSFRMNFGLTIGSAFLLTLPLMFFGRWIIRVWAGSAAVPSSDLLLCMGIWSLIYGATISQSCVLASAGQIERSNGLFDLSRCHKSCAIDFISAKDRTDGSNRWHNRCICHVRDRTSVYSRLNAPFGPRSTV